MHFLIHLLFKMITRLDLDSEGSCKYAMLLPSELRKVKWLEMAC